jgi:hypothetical protein
MTIDDIRAAVEKIRASKTRGLDSFASTIQ